MALALNIGHFVRIAGSRKKNGLPADFPKLETLIGRGAKQTAEPMSPELQWQTMAKLAPPKR